jgi:3-hydroxybutyryl-CoA dehydratase
MTVTDRGAPAVGPTERAAKTANDVMDQPFDLLEVNRPFSSRARTITEADVVGFAAITGDWHPQHTDAEFGAGSHFGQRVAHGLLLVGVAVGLVPNDYVIALRRVDSVVFKNPVVFGDTVHVEGVIRAKDVINEDAGLVSARWRIVNQRDDLVFKMDLQAVWRRSWA